MEQRRSALSPEVVQKLINVCHDAYDAWTTRRVLFDNNPYEELLNISYSKHREFLHWLSEITMDYALLQIAKLHDPAVTSRNITLSFAYVVEYGGWDDETGEKLRRIHKRLTEKFEELKSARNKVLCHNDLAALLNNKPLGAFPENADVIYFETLKEFITGVQGSPFEWAVAHTNDAHCFRELIVNDSEQRLETISVACVLSANQLEGVETNVVVFPEGIDEIEITTAQIAHPNALVVGSIIENGMGRGVLYHRGQNRIDYLKIGNDRRTKPSNNERQMPVYEAGNICVGVVICMDVDTGVFLSNLLQRIKSSSAEFKLVCVPADMAEATFSGTELMPQWEGVHVLLCNHIKTYPQGRAKSFISDTHRIKRVIQQTNEPLFAQLPSRLSRNSWTEMKG